jgi:hypothetical protein
MPGELKKIVIPNAAVSRRNLLSAGSKTTPCQTANLEEPRKTSAYVPTAPTHA